MATYKLDHSFQCENPQEENNGTHGQGVSQSMKTGGNEELIQTIKSTLDASNLLNTGQLRNP